MKGNSAESKTIVDREPREPIGKRHGETAKSTSTGPRGTRRGGSRFLLRGWQTPGEVAGVLLIAEGQDASRVYRVGYYEEVNAGWDWVTETKNEDQAYAGFLALVPTIEKDE